MVTNINIGRKIRLILTSSNLVSVISVLGKKSLIVEKYLKGAHILHI
jgi:hypothetical protein